MIRLFLISLAAVILAGSAKAAVLVSDFANFSVPGQLLPPMGLSWTHAGTDQYVQHAGFISIAPVAGGNPQGDGYFNAVISGGDADFTALPTLSLTAQVDPGNASSTLEVLFFDNTDIEVAAATFAASSFSSSFSTQEVPLSLTGTGDLTKVTYWRINGDEVSSDAFRFSFDNLAAVPEPATCLLMPAGLLAMLARRRKRIAPRQDNF